MLLCTIGTSSSTGRQVSDLRQELSHIYSFIPPHLQIFLAHFILSTSNSAHFLRGCLLLLVLLHPSNDGQVCTDLIVSFSTEGV